MPFALRFLACLCFASALSFGSPVEHFSPWTGYDNAFIADVFNKDCQPGGPENPDDFHGFATFKSDKTDRDDTSFDLGDFLKCWTDPDPPAAQTPEPGTLCLVGATLLSLGVLRRKRNTTR
jgi:hypothetical protein